MTTTMEFERAARQFLREHLPMLDRNYLEDTLGPAFAALLEKTVTEHTSKTSNTALRAAARDAMQLAQHAKSHMPSGASKCRCRELDNGEHALQPICHICALSRIEGIS